MPVTRDALVVRAKMAKDDSEQSSDEMAAIGILFCFIGSPDYQP